MTSALTETDIAASLTTTATTKMQSSEDEDDNKPSDDNNNSSSPIMKTNDDDDKTEILDENTTATSAIVSDNNNNDDGNADATPAIKQEDAAEDEEQQDITKSEEQEQVTTTTSTTEVVNDAVSNAVTEMTIIDDSNNATMVSPVGDESVLPAAAAAPPPPPAAVATEPVEPTPTVAAVVEEEAAVPTVTQILQQQEGSRPENPDHGPVGCYMVYESSSGGRLMLYYSQGPVPDNAVGFWCPGDDKKIQGFKFKEAAGRSDLIKGIAGGDSNRRKYFVGWCQFCKLAKSYRGKIIQFVPVSQGVSVDIYGYKLSENQPLLLDLHQQLTSLSSYDAVAVMPKHHEFLKGVKSIGMTQFLELGNLAGATTKLN